MSTGQPTPPDLRRGDEPTTPVVVKTSPDRYVGKILLGRYRVNSRVARGGMGSVYLARDMADGSNYAIKILRDDLVLEPRVRERFINEAQAAKRIEHPAVAKTYEVGEMSNGSIFIVMEFVNGPPLRRLIRQGPIPPRRVVMICAAVAEGLAQAHEKGVIHRDLKPENILIPRSNRATSVAKLVDFGIARMLDAPRITTTHHVMGTPQYISPEQAMGGPVDGRTDIYSLGVLMYEMLTGALPFCDKDAETLLRMHIKDRPTPIAELPGADSIDPTLEGLVMQCLEKSPRARPDDMESLVTFFSALG